MKYKAFFLIVTVLLHTSIRKRSNGETKQLKVGVADSLSYGMKK
jgi:hypothetical protein